MFSFTNQPDGKVYDWSPRESQIRNPEHMLLFRSVAKLYTFPPWTWHGLKNNKEKLVLGQRPWVQRNISDCARTSSPLHIVTPSYFFISMCSDAVCIILRSCQMCFGFASWFSFGIEVEVWMQRACCLPSCFFCSVHACVSEYGGAYLHDTKK